MDFKVSANLASSNSFAFFSKTIFACICIIFSYNKLSAQNNIEHPKETEIVISAVQTSLGGGIIIVMEDDILFTDSGNPEDGIDKIVISFYGNVVHTESSCGGQECSTNIGHLEPGIYLATVFTEGGSSSSKEIVLN